MSTKEAENKQSNTSLERGPRRDSSLHVGPSAAAMAEAVERTVSFEDDKREVGESHMMEGHEAGDGTGVIDVVRGEGDQDREVVEAVETGGRDEARRGMSIVGCEELREDNAVSEEVAAAAEGTAVAEVEENKELGTDAEAEDDEVTMKGEALEMFEVAETGVVENGGRFAGGKRKRGRIGKTHADTSMKKKISEDVCFICLDGGDLFLCDHRGCPKAYHPACVNRDEAFFQSKVRWSCGWHLCSYCKENAYYMCYTCTFSLCKGCIKDAVIFRVRGNKGFCETCMRTVSMIENSDKENMEMPHVDFDDKSSWEYLFKDYWLDLKGTLLITFNEICKAKNPWKGSKISPGRQEMHRDLFDAHHDAVSKPDNFLMSAEVNSCRRKKVMKWSIAFPMEDSSSRGKMALSEIHGDSSGERAVVIMPSFDGSSKWASKELLEFVKHMTNGDNSFRSQFEVRALLVEYIVKNKLRNPRWKSQIICDFRLQNLFRKRHVCHFEMLNLLEYHFQVKEYFRDDDLRKNVVDTKTSQQHADGTSDMMKMSKEMNQNNCMKGDGNLIDYAAIDSHNIKLIYLRRDCVEELLGDVDSFQDKVVGSFVRITVSGSQNQGLYKLVQVVGTRRTAEPYKAGKRVTDIKLEILNLNKVEFVSIDAISNQEFTEDECKRLRQGIRCGLIDCLTVVNVLDKAIALQAVRVNDWLQSEITWFSRPRDRVKEKGYMKEFKKCTEKLQLLNAPEERQQRLEEVPEMHTDSNMNPSHESEEDEDKAENYFRPVSSGFTRKMMDLVSPQKGGPGFSEAWGVDKDFCTINQDLTKSSSSKGLLKNGTDEYSLNQGRDAEMLPMSGKTLKLESVSLTSGRLSHISEVSEFPSSLVPKLMSNSPAAGVAHCTKIDESEKQWCYLDPTGNIQGPFSMAQLRKWSKNYFPSDLRIWRRTQRGENSILFTDALVGKFPKKLFVVDKSALNADTMHDPDSLAIYTEKLHGRSLLQPKGAQCGGNWGTGSDSGFSNVRTTTPSENSRHSTSGHFADQSVGNDFINLPPRTPLSDDEKEQTYISMLTLSSTSLEPAGSSNVTEDHPNVLKECQKPYPERIHSQSVIPFESQEANTITRPHPTSDSVTSTNPGANMGNTDGSQQNLLVTIPTQPPAYDPWGSASTSINNSALSNPLGNFAVPAVTAVPSESWGPAGKNVQPPMPPNPILGMGLTDNSGAFPRQGIENPKINSGPMLGNSNLVWERPQLGSSNMNWEAPSQGSAPGSVNLRLPSPWQQSAPENAIPCWLPSNHVQEPNDANTSWARPPQDKPPGNENTGCSARSGKSGMYRNEQSNEGSFSSKRNRNSYGEVSGYGRGKSWNRQSSFGSESGRFSKPHFPKGRVICKFHENGHCKKGAACNYLHA